MRDLQLWRSLLSDQVDAEHCLPRLEQLADSDLPARVPFLGPVSELAEHEEDRLRAAAFRCLSGASGSLAFHCLVRGLDDPHAEARLAALEALRTSAKHDPPRWAHALFHHDSTIRQAALSGEPVKETEWFALFLLADPDCERLAAEVLLKHADSVPGSSLPALIEMVQRGRLDAALARRVIVHINPLERNVWIHHASHRTPSEVTTLLDHAASPAADDVLARTKTFDALDPLIDLFWEADGLSAEEATQPPQEQFFTDLYNTLKASDLEHRQRAVASMLVIAARRGTWPRPAVETCLALWPSLLWCPWVPLSERRGAVRVFYRLGNQCVNEMEETIKALVGSDFCRRPNGLLDLWIIGGLLHLLEGQPYKLLQDWVPLPKIVSSFWDDPESSIPFLCLPDNSDKGRAFVLEELWKHRRPEMAKLLAQMVHAIPADGYDFLDKLTGQEAAGVALALLDLSETEWKTLSENKTRVASELLAGRILSGGMAAISAFLSGWMKSQEPEQFKPGLAIWGLIADGLPIEILQAVVSSYQTPELRTLIKLIGWCPGFPYGKERQLAEAYLTHPDWDIRRWALRCCPQEAGDAPKPKPARTIPRTGKELTDKQIERIATCGESSLETALRPALDNPSRGLCEALARRPKPASANVAACAALLGSHDSLRLINEQLDRFANWRNARFVDELEQMMVATWNRRQELPMIGHAWLYRWESHAFAFAELAERHSDEWEGLLRYAMNSAGTFLIQRVWSAMSRMVALFRYRDKPRLGESWTPRFAELAVENLGTPWGLPAAELLIHGFRAGIDPEHFEQMKTSVIARLTDMSAQEREILRPWVSSAGVPKLPTEPRPIKGVADEDILEKIAASTDFDLLETWCFDPNPKIADEAALRLLEFEEPGAARLLKILSGDPLPPSALLIAETVSLWPDGPALSSALDLVRNETRPLPLRFLIGLNLLERGQKDLVNEVIELINAESPTTWFQSSDWTRLLNAGQNIEPLALAVCVSPHPHAYLPAMRWLLETAVIEAEHVAAVRRFLEADSERLFEFRLKAAAWLMKQGDRTGFPILVQHAAQNNSGPNPLTGATAKEITATVGSALIAGNNFFPEEWLFDLVKDGVSDPWLQQQAFEPMLSRCVQNSVREAIVPRLQRTASRSLKLRRIAEEFAWGIRMGRELTGRLFTVQMIGGEDLGYTRLEENRIYITPMPILRGERNARDVVRGLILHEFGHHMYHRGEEEQAIWEKAHNEGIGRLLNLVSDEHLERNLRALDDSFGDRLKKLAAYAFQHSKKEMPIADLLHALQGRAFEVLVGTRLLVARRRGCVVVDNGQLLLEMEKSGLSFARFVRALRMGLGNRHDDPKVEAGLGLFRKKFRKSTMPRLFDIAKKLREIFGWECSLLESFGQDECLASDPSEMQAQGEGITDQEVQSEIQRINNPRKSREKAGEGKGGARWINVSGEEHFETISTIVPMAFDRGKHAPYAQLVARPARQLRQYLKDLGLSMVQHRMRVAGRVLDRTRIPAVVLRNDPRMLIARQRTMHNDLFLGAVIDCSGSMDYDDNIEKAKMFGALLAEAVNGLDGVDLRLFGFTDAVIHDAGDERRPAVHSLFAGGGNNDAAALWHAAQVAQASRRKAKVLVMISDGLPTECSAAALKSLATRLTNRQKICCAQVAVQPLEEICFPHYILLEEADVPTSVRRFGNTVARLVKRAMSTG